MAAKNPAWRISADFQGGSGRGESDFRPSRPPRRRLQNRRPPGAGDAEAQGGLIKTRPSKPALSPLPRAGRRAKIAQAQTAKCALQDNVFPPPLNSGSALLWHGSVFDVATLNVFPPGSRPAGAGASIRRRHAAGEGVKESSPPSFRTSGAATAGTENNRRELFHPRRRAVSCEAALRILSNGEACPPCGGDSGYFPSACAK